MITSASPQLIDDMKNNKYPVSVVEKCSEKSIWSDKPQGQQHHGQRGQQHHGQRGQQRHGQRGQQRGKKRSRSRH